MKHLSIFLALLVAMVVTPVTQAGKAKPYTLTAITPFAAADFSLTGEDGKTYRLSDYRGKVVVLNFWATWCPPCRYEMPAMERAWQKLKGRGVVILAVNVGENEEQIFPFTASYPVSFPLPMDQKGEVIKHYPVIGLPTTFIINPKGKATHRVIGTREWDHDAIIGQLIVMTKK